PAELSRPSTAPQKRASQLWWLFVGIFSVVLLAGCWLLVQFLSPQKPVAKSPDMPAAPTPVESPAANGAAEAIVTPAETAAIETPTLTETPNEARIAASSATPIRRKPGERLRGSASPDYSSPSALNASPPPQTYAAAPAAGAKQPIVREIAASSQLGDEYRPNLA